MMLHPDLEGVNVYGVQHAYGDEPRELRASDGLFDAIFGRDGWTDAVLESDKNDPDLLHVVGQNYNFNGNRVISVQRIYDRVLPILQNGGRVWIQEAGQSDVTRDWAEKLINEDNGISAADVRTRVILVQHSSSNEGLANDEDLAWVQANTNYVKIADGNSENDTPGYRSEDKDNPDPYHLTSATAEDNPNPAARDLWRLADDYIHAQSASPNIYINRGGVDFSDCSENWWILDLGDRAYTMDAFWERYVINFNPSTFAIANTNVAPGTIGRAYEVQMVAAGGVTPYTWSIISGALPAGLSLNPASGLISGVPTTVQTANFTVQVQDADGSLLTKSYLMAVSESTFYLESGGVVVMDVEFSPIIDRWSSETSVAGYTGTSYYKATANSFSTPGLGLLEYPFLVNTSGDYQLQWRSYIAEGTDSTEHNDTFARLVDADGNTVAPANAATLSPTSGWYKTYMSTRSKWSWQASNADNNAQPLHWNLAAGQTSRFQISARSQGHAIDRILLWDRNGTGDYGSQSTGKVTDEQIANAEALPVSEISGAGLTIVTSPLPKARIDNAYSHTFCGDRS
ncbi:MAG: hypothetical protein HC901_00145 [Bdellovibrionaceae bacterium]|nr:hypothetical protein [Pseudobdellovibrionaceae bacterium]